MSSQRYTYAGHARDIAFAVGKAIAVPEEESLRVLLGVLNKILLTAQPPETIDGWVRLAAVEGARKAWSGRPNTAPPDVPTGTAGLAFVTAQTASYVYTLAAKKAGQHGG